MWWWVLIFWGQHMKCMDTESKVVFLLTQRKECDLLFLRQPPTSEWSSLRTFGCFQPWTELHQVKTRIFRFLQRGKLLHWFDVVNNKLQQVRNTYILTLKLNNNVFPHLCQCLSDHVIAAFVSETTSAIEFHYRLNKCPPQALVWSHITNLRWPWVATSVLVNAGAGAAGYLVLMRMLSLTLPCCLSTCSPLFIPPPPPPLPLFLSTFVCVYSLSAHRSPPPHPCFPQAPFCTVCECKSIHSYSLSGSCMGSSPDPILPGCIY